MLKIFIIIFVAVICAVNAAPVNDNGYQNYYPDGTFQTNIPNNNQHNQYQYDLEYRHQQSQVGYFNNFDTQRPMVWLAKGSYFFIAPDGKTYKVEYIVKVEPISEPIPTVGPIQTFGLQQSISTSGGYGPVEGQTPEQGFTNCLLSLCG